MTRDDIIRMARKAGFVQSNAHSNVIVRHSNGSWVSVQDLLENFAAMVVAAEREACAQICDSYARADHANYADSCAEEIRARGNA